MELIEENDKIVIWSNPFAKAVPVTLPELFDYERSGVFNLATVNTIKLCAVKMNHYV